MIERDRPWSSRVGPGPRPWTEAGLASIFAPSSHDEGRRVFYADSAAREQLAHALGRYIRGEVSGASYVLAADPGTGKTTTVEWVVQQLYAECLGPHSTFRGHRPLLVRLYGPNLAPIRRSGPDAIPEPDPAKHPPVLQLLRDMAVSLFEAVLAEIERTVRLSLTPEQQSKSRNLELFLQLRHELRRGPAVVDLMAYWRSLGWGNQGAFSQRPDHRGAAEVAVLQDLAEARLAVVSEVQDRRGSTASAEAEQVRTRTVNPTDLLQTSTAIVAGVAAAAGLVVDGSWILAGLIGPLVTAGVGGALTLTGRSARRQFRQDERAYTLKADVESLIHRIPRLLQGLRSIGIHPVFVVDELDKVDPELVSLLVHNLKTQLTEQSFFCFLTDIDSATAEDRGARKDHRLAYRYFWDRIYLVQTTAALHGYLQVYLAEGSVESPSDRYDAVVILRHVLLLQAEHHPRRLHRALDRARHEGLLHRIDRDPSGVITDPGLRMHLRFALATEWAMAELVTEISNDPWRLQVAKDMLYRPWRSWRDGEARCGLTRLMIYREVRDKTEDRDFASHVARALETLLEQLAATAFPPRHAPDDARTRAYRHIQPPPQRLASRPAIDDTGKRGIEVHAYQGPMLDRTTNRWLERPPIVQELDTEYRYQQLAAAPYIKLVGGLESCIDILFKACPSREIVAQRDHDVLTVAFLAHAIAVRLERSHPRALQAIGVLVSGVVQITAEMIEQLGQHLHINNLHELIEAADTESLDHQLKDQGPLDPPGIERLRQRWYNDWARRLGSARNEDDRSSLLDPIADVLDWPRDALWRWHPPAQREHPPERSVALWSEVAHAAYREDLPPIFGLVALKQLGFSPRRDRVESTLAAFQGSDSTRQHLAEGFGQQRPAPHRILIIETSAGGVGDKWDIDPVYPTLLLNTDRDDAEAMWSSVLDHIEPTPPILRLGRMTIESISKPEPLTAYILEQGHLQVPGAPDRPVISDPGCPRATIEQLEHIGVAID